MAGNITRRCSHCDISFKPARRDVRYCSGACKQRAKRERRSFNASDELQGLLRANPERTP